MAKLGKSNADPEGRHTGGNRKQTLLELSGREDGTRAQGSLGVHAGEHCRTEDC